ncbi:MAG TPA: hypothetical protein VLZ89_16680 [Anaerolineales bacterium]|nr:hypothetical protein [Anaerolineales bacterium]
MKNRSLFPLLAALLLLLVFLPGQPAFACGSGTSFDGGDFYCSAGGSSSGTETQVTVTSGNGGGSGNGGASSHDASTTPQTTDNYAIDTYGQVPGTTNSCYHLTIDLEGDRTIHYGDCGYKKRGGGGGKHTKTFVICNGVIVTSTDVSCTTKWKLTAHVGFPAIPIDTRPYPATLNRYPTVLRVDELQTASGSASLAYIPAGGGSAGHPKAGDMRNVKLTLTLYPKTAVPPQVDLENFGWIELPLGELYTFSWPLPSHPSAGGGPTAAAVGQLQELPQDMPLYTNYARAPYGLTCELDWEQYTSADTWRSHSQTNEILPSQVKGLPPSEAADTNGDGKPDAFWDLGVVIRRMNDAGSISDPVYAHSYSWGDVFYWAVREAQGEITFP